MRSAALPFFVVLGVLLASCLGGDDDPALNAATLPTMTATASAEPRETAFATPTAEPTATQPPVAQRSPPAPTAEPTSTGLPSTTRSPLIVGPNGEALPPRSEWTTAMVTTDNVNIRVQPAVEWLMVGQLHPGDQVLVAGRSPDGEWLAIPETGWVFYSPDWVSLDVDFAHLPEVDLATIVGPSHHRDVRTGTVAVDHVIDLVMAGDAEAIAGLAAVEMIPCQPLGFFDPAPRCPAGVAAGTLVDNVGASRCHADPLAPSHAAQYIQTWVLAGESLPLVHAVTLTRSGYALHLRSGRHMIQEQSGTVPADGEGRTLHIDRDGNVTGISIGCFTSAPVFADSDRSEGRFLLPPPVPEPATAAPRAPATP